MKNKDLTQDLKIDEKALQEAYFKLKEQSARMIALDLMRELNISFK